MFFHLPKSMVKFNVQDPNFILLMTNIFFTNNQHNKMYLFHIHLREMTLSGNFA